ncbi:carbamoyltransferase N-terminal domain-containing protein [Mangrovihabitans endophyticus]|uniref:carbamoyltransferase N-terminal domain-containing protein n=1 Tax=Mangrovihabitans endophyticus TaxID=1751298 RepID=UPI001E568586|nr:carbamoyltransferase N-terminal domain-containing protein [Mangrovihabitans endophyticus]
MKVTHDGTVALLDDNRLIGSVEMEKLDNGLRYAELTDLATIERIVRELGYDVRDVEAFVVDGWGYGERRPTVRTGGPDGPVHLPVAPYREAALTDDTAKVWEFDGLPLAGSELKYTSYHHVTGHIYAAYCASPFAAAGEPSFVLVWDGGILPRCYYVRPDGPRVENLGPVLGLIGNIYPTFAMRFPPFRPQDLGGPPERQAFHQLTVPGKVMAYTALGQVRPELCEEFDRIYDTELTVSMAFAATFADRFLERTRTWAYEPSDAMASFQHWVGERLVGALRRVRERAGDRVPNLCLSGGCALNIKWNSAVRRSELFDAVWVPPFPNDSGSALGVACAEMVRRTGTVALDWSVYRGPAMPKPTSVEGYRSDRCTVTDLAEVLHRTGEPVLVLHDRAELGPRALGHRSILAAPTASEMKHRLNSIKKREAYRPVSPICLEDRAQAIFDPGTPDPYMLFEHQIRPDWRARIPAVMHLDGSARLQTVNPRQAPVIAELLARYEQLSGVPVLCNTSANFNGSGFFPDLDSAARWGQVRYIWNDGVLWTREQAAS